MGNGTAATANSVIANAARTSVSESILFLGAENLGTRTSSIRLQRGNEDNDGQILFYTADLGTETLAMKIAEDQKTTFYEEVTINTSALSAELNLRTTGNSTYSAIFHGTDNSTGAGYSIVYGSNHGTQANEYSFKNQYGDFTFYNTTGGSGLTKRMTLDTSGNLTLGNGETNLPYTITGNSNRSSSGQANLVIAGADNGVQTSSIRLQRVANPNDGRILFYTASGGTEALALTLGSDQVGTFSGELRAEELLVQDDNATITIGNNTSPAGSEPSILAYGNRTTLSNDIFNIRAINTASGGGTARLDFLGNNKFRFSGDVLTQAALVLEGTVDARIELATGQNYGSINVTGNVGTTGGYAGYAINNRWTFMDNNSNRAGLYNDNANEWGVRCSDNAEVDLYYNGAIKLSTSNTGITVTGEGTATDWIATSDERLKKNFTPYGSVLERVAGLRGAFSYFTWLDSGVNDIGYSAQRVEEVFPEFVKESNGWKSISYQKLAGIALEGVAEVNDEVEVLKDRIVELEERIVELESVR